MLKRGRIHHAAALVAVGSLLSGCATRALWSGDLVESYNEPSLPSHTAVFSDSKTGDFIVAYDELNPWSSRPRRKAFVLKSNLTNLSQHIRPSFVRLDVTLGLAPLPECAPRGNVPQEPTNGRACVSLLADGRELTVVDQEGVPWGPYRLPTYRGAAGVTKLVLLTPVMVLADLLLVGALYAYGAAMHD